MISCIQQDDSLREQFTLDGNKPDFVAVPASEEEAVQVVEWAKEGNPLVPWGAGNAIQQGNILQSAGWSAVSTSKMNALVDYSPSDMVVSVQAGMPLQTLQDILKKENQFLPFDPPHTATATLAGIVATNAQGLIRPLYGTPRDRLLSMRVVLGDGSVVRAGGKVVKNVAGYDLCKLFAGSWGTLGFITEVTFKTNPLPEAQKFLLFSAPTLLQGASAALNIHIARLQPACLTLIQSPQPVLAVGLMGNAKAIAWQEEQITRTLESEGVKPFSEGFTEENVRNLFVDSTDTLARVTLSPSDIPAYLEKIEGVSSQIRAQIPVGVLDIALPQESANSAESSLTPSMSRLKAALPSGGHLVWVSIPPERKHTLDVWGEKRGDFHLMKGIKATLDPHNIFSPGRFIGRL